MRVRPQGAELSRLADRTLSPDLFSQSEERRRYVNLMVANAKAISVRQIKAGDEPERLELETLAALCRESVAATEAEEVRAALVRLYQRFCSDLRAGGFDPRQPGHDAARAHLMEVTQQRARESAPKALEGK